MSELIICSIYMGIIIKEWEKVVKRRLFFNR